jgi:hypothetical protein
MCCPVRLSGQSERLQRKGDKKLLNSRIPVMRNQAWIGLSLFILGLWLAWEIGGKIAAEDLRSLEYAFMAIAACCVAVTILRNWRTGFYLFFVWLMFEDLVRKYMGNSTELFFGKDVLLAFVYVALYIEIRHHREKAFRPPFLIFLSLFFWLGVLQVFNQNSPHILYGLLGFKVYFYYVPLLWVGYALIRSDEDLRKFLVVNAVLAGLIGALGIAQGILGNGFLNPAHLAPELEELGDLSKASPLTNRAFSLPSSVFVSSGRFAQYLLVAFILIFGTAAYLLLHSRLHRKLVFTVLAIVGVATLLSGSRTAFVGVLASALVLSAGLLWGAPWRWRQAHRLVRTIRRSFIVAALALAALLMVFPEEAGSRMAFYTETLSPNSTAYELGSRSWDYPITNFLLVFSQPNWVIGNGIGTASLGRQYVAKALGGRMPAIGVEEGYGTLIVEMGIIAPFLWILWTAALLYYSWKVVRPLRGTHLFPIALAIIWYAFALLYPMTYSAIAAYQNYTCNAYLWLLVGILFRLPDVLVSSAVPAVVSSRPQRNPGGLTF